MASIYQAPRFPLEHTPPKPRRFTGSTPATKAGQVENDVRDELHHDFFGNTCDFVSKVFKDVSPTLVEEVYQSCITVNDVYNQSEKRWRGFPPDDKYSEPDLYAPFVHVANSISEYSIAEASEPPCGQSIRWLSDPYRPVPNNHAHAADFKPDIIAAVNFAGDVLGKVPWPRIQVAMEVKKFAAAHSAVLQVAKYMRQGFRECLDRRFVLGLVLSHRKVTVYLADRSGLVGSEIFDMHTVSANTIMKSTY